MKKFILILFVLSLIGNTKAQEPTVKDMQGVFFHYIIQKTVPPVYPEVHVKYSSYLYYKKDVLFQFTLKSAQFSFSDDKWKPADLSFHLILNSGKHEKKGKSTFYYYKATTKSLTEYYSVGFEVDQNGWIKSFHYEIVMNLIWDFQLSNSDSIIEWY